MGARPPAPPAGFHTRLCVQARSGSSTGLANTKNKIPPPYFIVVQFPVLKKDGNFYLEDISLEFPVMLN